MPKLQTFWKKIEVSDRISKSLSQPNPWCPSPLTFKTGTGLKVHTDLEHPTQGNEAELKCKHCVITCSDLNVMKKHILREHKFKCTQCTEAFKEECKLKTHTTNAHKWV